MITGRSIIWLSRRAVVPFGLLLTGISGLLFVLADRSVEGVPLQSRQIGSPAARFLQADQELDAVSCPTVYLCYGVGGYAAADQQQHPLIATTSDMGQTWNVRRFPDRFNTMSEISCSNQSTCLVVDTIPGKVLMTADSGASWVSRDTKLPAGVGIFFASCPSPTTCVLIDNLKKVSVSRDGGITWQRQIASIAQNANLYLMGLRCPSTTICYAFGYGILPVRPYLFNTMDGGLTWSAIDFPGALDWVNDVRCPSNSVCYAAGREGGSTGGQVVILTRDGGETWTNVSQGISGGPTYVAISCPESEVCYVVGTLGYAYRTDDGGTSWTAQPMHFLASNGANISCATASFCIAVGAVTLVTTDGGQTWRDPWPYGTSFRLYALDCPNPTSCVAVGEAGVILVSGDGARTWTQRESRVVDSLSSINCPGQNVCFATGTENFLKTVDGGSTWRPLLSVRGVLRGTACPTLSLCVVSTDGGLVFRTADGGATWQSQSVGKTLWAIDCPTSEICFGVGDEGYSRYKILLSLDAGLSWIDRSPNIGGGLLDVSCPSPDLCLAVGYVGVGDNAQTAMLKTVDRGANWQVQTGSTRREILWAITCPSDMVCYTIRNDGQISKTRDAGVNWQVVGTKPGLYDVTCLTPDVCHFVGSGGQISSTFDGGATWTALTNPPPPLPNQVPVGNVLLRESTSVPIR